MTLPTKDLTQLIGTAVLAPKAELTSGAKAAALRELLEQRGILVFPRVEMQDEEQLAFARTLGEVINQGEKGIYKITLDKKITPSAEYLKGTILWHIDGWADDVPARGSILSARVLSPTGGQTEFSNAYAAYEELSAEKKAQIASLKVYHTMAGTQRDIYDHITPEQEADWASHPAKLHPLVWTHRSGRKSLLLGSSADWVDGMDKEEGRALLAELKAWARQPRFVYRHEWTVGDMIIWDNCGVLHRVEPYPADAGRMMHRVTLVGEEAIA